MGTKGATKRNIGFAFGAAIAFALVLAGFGAYAVFTSNPQTTETHGKAGWVASTVSVGKTSITYGTAGLSGYATCVEAPYGPAPTIDVVINFTNVAPGDMCTATATITNIGSLPAYISATPGLSNTNICPANSLTTPVDCWIVTDSLAGATGVTIAAGATLDWTITIQLAPGSTHQGIMGEYISNAYETIGQ